MVHVPPDQAVPALSDDDQAAPTFSEDGQAAPAPSDEDQSSDEEPDPVPVFEWGVPNHEAPDIPQFRARPGELVVTTEMNLPIDFFKYLWMMFSVILWSTKQMHILRSL